MTSPARQTMLLERLYRDGHIVEAQVLQVAIGVARGGSVESGGAIRESTAPRWSADSEPVVTLYHLPGLRSAGHQAAAPQPGNPPVSRAASTAAGYSDWPADCRAGAKEPRTPPRGQRD